MLAAHVMESAIRDLVSRELAGEPDVLAGALRRIDVFATTSRNIMSRANLAAVLGADKPPA
jgi:hypothetical protein